MANSRPADEISGAMLQTRMQLTSRAGEAAVSSFCPMNDTALASMEWYVELRIKPSEPISN
jgi:hypothetical protein